MRIRTEGDYAYRRDVIERAADFYGCNRTEAVTRACEDVPGIIAAARRVLERDDLTTAQKREIAAEFSQRRGTSFDVLEEIVADQD